MRFVPSILLLCVAGIALRAGSAPASAPARKKAAAIPAASLPGLKAGTGPSLLAEGKVGADWVTIKAGDEEIRGYAAWPGGKGPFPALVVIHEWWGLNDWVMKQTRQLAAHGYVALAVDLYRGQSAKDADTAHQLMRALAEDRAVKYLHGAFNVLAAAPAVVHEKIGAIGWCMGGGYTAALAVNEPRLKAAVINYGSLPDDAAHIAQIKAHLLGNFGGLDKGIPLADAEKFKTAFTAAGGQFELHEWPASGHGFMNETNPNHNVNDTADAWVFIHAFLSKELGGKAVANWHE